MLSGFKKCPGRVCLATTTPAAMPKGSFSNNKVPERWEAYKSMGRQIPGTRFIAFKVPLREGIMSKVKECEWFSPRTLMDHCTNLGLVVDLTNTSRYYQPEVLTSHGIEHAKVFTEGKVIPKNEVVYKFFNIVNNFLKLNKNNEKLIGVHCTHGINRSGYIICRYMIQQLGISPDQAITDFNSARGHVQERENYLADLRQARWIKDVVPADVPTTTSLTPNSSRGPASSRRPPLNYSQSNNWENRNNEAEWSPWSKEPARRWSLSPGNLRERREGWAPWKGASPRQSPQELPKQQKAPSPYEARQYYDERYHGRVAPQYDPYFYQERGSGIGPHRPAPRWVQKNQYEQAGRPRQYRGPRPYRSPLQSEEPAAQIEESRETPTRTPTGSKFHPSLPRTPYWPPEGPKRDPLSPGARDNVFSPVTPRRRSSRWNPY
nr:RNA/RNP complex-1-interacting phosphatase-like isoform X2 [Procambarus clarkii]